MSLETSRMLWNCMRRLWKSSLKALAQLMRAVSVADTKNNIAIVYGNLGNQTKRLQLNREAHSIYLQALGPEHPKTMGIAPFI
mmetsp:Transcript_42205/g.88214  ORF Transcript_42205/g.88214 Transcript_42205/m.88214 type:complete len:83 (-) Transcript_42205:231-479(-)